MADSTAVCGDCPARRARSESPTTSQRCDLMRTSSCERSLRASLAFSSSSRLRGGAVVVSDRISLRAASVTSSTAVFEGSSLAREGRAVPLSLRTNCSADAWISSSVAGGSKFASVSDVPAHEAGILTEAGEPANRGTGERNHSARSARLSARQFAGPRSPAQPVSSRAGQLFVKKHRVAVPAVRREREVRDHADLGPAETAISASAGSLAGVQHQQSEAVRAARASSSAINAPRQAAAAGRRCTSSLATSARCG